MNTQRGAKDGFRSVSFWFNTLTSGLTLLLCPWCSVFIYIYIYHRAVGREATKTASIT